jgi:hypothetical protein
MKKIISNIFDNEKGYAINIALAMVLVAVTISSLVSLVHLVNEDKNSVIWLQDRMQQELLLRSENRRVHYALENNLPHPPVRSVLIAGRDRVATHRISHSRRTEDRVTSMGFLASQVVVIRTRCTTRYSRSNLTGTRSPVISQTESLSLRSSLALYQYFTDNEISDITDDPDGPGSRVRFYGGDRLDGRVHSNSNIWIRNAPGSPNVNPQAPGWPLFKAPVTTAGKIRIMVSNDSCRPWGSGDPMEDIFQGGFEEDVPPIIYDPDAREIKRNGVSPFGETSAGLDLVVATIDHGAVSLEIATFHTRVDTITVFTQFPCRIEPNLPFGRSRWTNNVTFTDTLWLAGPVLNLNNRSAWIPSTIWVKGDVAGSMTIGSAGDAFIIGHISYAGTNLGTRPDGYDLNGNPVPGINTRDYFGLVSESSIYIKYKYKNRAGETIAYPMSVGPSGNVYLYGAFSAQGVRDPALGEFDYKAEGVFSFEYQHPHGSPTPYVGRHPFWHDSQDDRPCADGCEGFGTPFLWKNIDMRRFQFPPSLVGPGPQDWRRWPGGHYQPNTGRGWAEEPNQSPALGYWGSYCYPGYNPVGPERHAGATPLFPGGGHDSVSMGRFGDGVRFTDITYLRGNLWVFGSIAQRRRGFIRRSGSGGNDNPDQGAWNPDRYVFGSTRPSVADQNFATGYEKRYYYDERFVYVQPPDFPEVYQGSLAGQMSAFHQSAWNFRVPPRSWTH